MSLASAAQLVNSVPREPARGVHRAVLEHQDTFQEVGAPHLVSAVKFTPDTHTDTRAFGAPVDLAMALAMARDTEEGTTHMLTDTIQRSSQDLAYMALLMAPSVAAMDWAYLVLEQAVLSRRSPRAVGVPGQQPLLLPEEVLGLVAAPAGRNAVTSPWVKSRLWKGKALFMVVWFYQQ